MPTADATLLPAPSSGSSGADRAPDSSRSLEAVGVGTVLGAMIEQRRASQPHFARVVVPTPTRAQAPPANVLDDGPEDVADRVPAASEVFLKAR